MRSPSATAILTLLAEHEPSARRWGWGAAVAILAVGGTGMAALPSAGPADIITGSLLIACLFGATAAIFILPMTLQRRTLKMKLGLTVSYADISELMSKPNEAKASMLSRDAGYDAGPDIDTHHF